MTTNTLEMSRQYTSLSGCDINIVIGGEIMGSAVSMSYATNREKVPIYTCGSPDPRSFSRGKRGLAGSWTNLMLDKHILYKEPFVSSYFLARNSEIFPNLGNGNSAEGRNFNDLQSVGNSVFDTGNLTSNYTVHSPWYLDQVPPLDAVIMGANEYGSLAEMRIYGIELLNEGGGFSVDDQTIEIQTTYVCTKIRPWRALATFDITKPGAPVMATN